MLPPRLAVTTLFTAALLLFATSSLAQETTGNLEGKLFDGEGKPVAFANVIVTGPSLQGGRGVLSTSDGYFGVFKLPVGVYTVKISHVSFQEAICEEVAIRLGQTTTLGKITLTTKTYEAPAVIVTEKRLLIDPTSTVVGATLNQEEFRDLPIDRNYMNIANLLPHANESYLGDETNFAGATGQENKYFIDGAETTDPYLGVTGTHLPYNFVEEVEVKAGSYEAEYRSALGGIVNVVSRSGSNDFRGQVFGFFVNNQFAGDSRTGVAEPVTGDFSQYDVGVSVAGPIRKDRLWYFAAYNPTYSKEDVDIPGQGFYPDKSVVHMFAGKLDWRPSQKTHLTFTTTGDPGTRDAVGELFGSAGTPISFANPDPFLADVTTGGVNAIVSGTYLFNDDVMVEADVSVVTRTLKMIAATEIGRREPLFVDRETGEWSGGYLSPTDDASLQITTDAKSTFVVDRHLIKLGAGYRDNQLDFNEVYDVLARSDDTTFAQIYFGAVGGSVSNRILSAFAQDSWRVTDRLRVNAGLRWEGQWVVASNGEVGQKILDQYQPRVGAVYVIGEPGTKKVAASFGRFYQELGLSLPLNKLNAGSLFRYTAWDHDPRIDPSGGSVYEEPGGIANEVDGLKGQHYDEYTLGYSQQMGERFVVGARGIYRTLREAIEDGYSAELDATVFGNPGRGLLSNLPKATRDYTALELTAQIVGGPKYAARASYVLSRSEGNYTGLFYSDGASGNYILPNGGPLFNLQEMTVNADGLLPNDHTHVFKLSGSYRTDFGLTAGTSFLWQSGTPLSVRAAASRPTLFNFAQQRGSAGRTPDIWDLNFRFTYDIAHHWTSRTRPRLVMDVFHLFSQREPVKYDQIRNYGQDDLGNPVDFNPTYGLATRYQPPTAVRLGMEIDF